MIAEAICRYKEKNGFGRFVPKAVLFDMDGVCYDSMPNHAAAWHRAMASYGIAMSEAEAFRYEGMRGSDIIKSVVKQRTGRETSEEDAVAMYEEKARLFSLMPRPAIMPGVVCLMRQIRAAGMQICVVTGSGQRPLLARLLNDFSEFIDDRHLVTAFDVRRGKPLPDPYLMGLDKCGKLQPWEAIVVENAPLGVRAGVGARIFTVAVNSGPLPDAALADEGADLVFPTMAELAEQWRAITAAQDAPHS